MKSNKKYSHSFFLIVKDWVEIPVVSTMFSWTKELKTCSIFLESFTLYRFLHWCLVSRANLTYLTQRRRPREELNYVFIETFQEVSNFRISVRLSSLEVCDKVMHHFLESSCHSWIGFSRDNFLPPSSVNQGFFEELMYCTRAWSEALSLGTVSEKVSHGFVWVSTSSTSGRYLAFLRVRLQRLVGLAPPDHRLDWFCSCPECRDLKLPFRISTWRVLPASSA